MNFFKKNKSGSPKDTSKTASSLLKKLGQGKKTFGGGGQALGGSRPGEILTICFDEGGPLGMKIEENHEGGAVVSAVHSGGMAERVGLQRGDIICWSESEGEECPFNEFMDVVSGGVRPLTIDVKRIKLGKGISIIGSANVTDTSATAETRRAAVIAAAQNRANAEKKKQKPLSKAGNYKNTGVSKVNADLGINDRTGEEISEATKRAVMETKRKEKPTR